MAVQRIRSARAIAAHYKRLDPGTAITETLIRRLMDSGELPTFNSGRKRMTSLEAVEKWIKKQLAGGG